jgi:hypothetical protein
MFFPQTIVISWFKLVHMFNAILLPQHAIGLWSKLYLNIAMLHLNLPLYLCDGLYCIPQAQSLIWSIDFHYLQIT